MSLNILTIAMTYRRSVGIQWEFSDPTAATISGVVRYRVLRSGSPGGPWDVVSPDIDGTIYEDELNNGDDGHNILDARREIWYKVAMYVDSSLYAESPPTDEEGNVAVSVEQVDPLGLMGEHKETSVQNRTVFMRNPTQPRRLALVQRLVTRRSLVALHRFNGTQLTLFKRRNWGPRCTTCYDPRANVVLFSECPECYGVGRQYGYYTPIEFFGKLDVQESQLNIAEGGQTRITQATIQTIQYPVVAKHDIIYSHDDGKFWEVAQMMDGASLQGRGLTQIFAVLEVSPTRSVYNLPIPMVRRTWEQTTS